VVAILVGGVAIGVTQSEEGHGGSHYWAAGQQRAEGLGLVR
jgi:hypothetical protein